MRRAEAADSQPVNQVWTATGIANRNPGSSNDKIKGVAG
jgi:hypothetical protein